MRLSLWKCSLCGCYFGFRIWDFGFSTISLSPLSPRGRGAGGEGEASINVPTRMRNPPRHEGSDSFLRLLRPVPAAGLFAVGDTQRIKDAADDFIAYAGEVADAAAADQDDRVFL